MITTPSTGYVTFNVGLRWDQEQIERQPPRPMFQRQLVASIGHQYRPFGDRKSKFFFNWGRYTQASSQMDAAIRELNRKSILHGELDARSGRNSNAVINRATGTVTPVLDAAHLISGDPAAGR